MAEAFSWGSASVDPPTWERLLTFSPSTTSPMTALVAVVLLLLLPGAAQFDRTRRSVRLLAGISSIAILVQAVGWYARYWVGTPPAVHIALVDRLLYGLPNYTMSVVLFLLVNTRGGSRPTTEPDGDPDDPFRPPPSPHAATPPS